jgi:hypothetical protein
MVEGKGRPILEHRLTVASPSQPVQCVDLAGDIQANACLGKPDTTLTVEAACRPTPLMRISPTGANIDISIRVKSKHRVDGESTYATGQLNEKGRLGCISRHNGTLNIQLSSEENKESSQKTNRPWCHVT